MRARVDFTRSCAALIACVGLASAQQPSQEHASIPLFGTTVVVSSGLRGEIYFIRKGTTSLPRFKYRKPVGTIYTTSLNIPTRYFSEGFPGITDRFEWFAIDYTGRFWTQQAGQYNFGLTSDDGSKLYIDDHLVIDDDGIHSPSGCTATTELKAGIHAIRVSYFQGPRYTVSLTLTVEKPGEPWRIFNTADFMPPPDSAAWTAGDGASIKNQLRKVKVGHCWAQ